MKPSLHSPRTDCFLPYGTEDQIASLAQALHETEHVRQICVLCPAGRRTPLPDTCRPIYADSLLGTQALRDIAAQCEAEYCLLYLKALPLELGFHALERLLRVADDTQADFLYTDHYTILQGARQPHPLIDYLEGSLRDDFDFGSLLLIRTKALKAFASQPDLHDYRYAGWYDLRLFLSRHGEIFHLNECLYTEIETDTRTSGEKNFDYVDPKNRTVQIEMEQACTEHLKRTGAYLAPEEVDEVDFWCEDYE